jgi:hypothetical protein
MPTPGPVSVPINGAGVVPYTPTVSQTGCVYNTITGFYKKANGFLYVWGRANLVSGGGSVAALVITLPFTVELDQITTLYPVGSITNNGSGTTAWARSDLAVAAGSASVTTSTNFTAIGGSVYSWQFAIPVIG